ncbi:hypothetical protein ACTGW8_13005 [Streptococcus suis]
MDRAEVVRSGMVERNWKLMAFEAAANANVNNRFTLERHFRDRIRFAGDG